MCLPSIGASRHPLVAERPRVRQHLGAGDPSRCSVVHLATSWHCPAGAERRDFLILGRDAGVRTVGATCKMHHSVVHLASRGPCSHADVGAGHDNDMRLSACGPQHEVARCTIRDDDGGGAGAWAGRARVGMLVGQSLAAGVVAGRSPLLQTIGADAMPNRGVASPGGAGSHRRLARAGRWLRAALAWARRGLACIMGER